MNPKIEFAEAFRNRTRKFALDVIKFLALQDNYPAKRVIDYQLTKSCTSTASNYRAACRARSQAEFHAKISIAVEEADESLFWLELVEELQSKKYSEFALLKEEALTILKILAKARKNS